MATRDPLAQGIVQFPGSTFDPVSGFTGMMDARLIAKKKAREDMQKAYKAYDVTRPEAWEEAAYSGLAGRLGEYEDMLLAYQMEGIDPRDVRSKEGLAAGQKTRGAYSSLLSDADIYKKQGEIWKGSMDIIAKDKDEKYDREKSMENLTALYQAKTPQEKQDIINKGLLVSKPRQYSIADVIGSKEMLSAFLPPEVGKTATVVDGRVRSTEWEKIEPDAVRNYFDILLRDKVVDEERGITFADIVKQKRDQSMGDTELSDTDWLMKNYGNTLSREEFKTTLGAAPGRRGTGTREDPHIIKSSGFRDFAQMVEGAGEEVQKLIPSKERVEVWDISHPTTKKLISTRQVGNVFDLDSGQVRQPEDYTEEGKIVQDYELKSIIKLDKGFKRVPRKGKGQYGWVKIGKPKKYVLAKEKVEVEDELGEKTVQENNVLIPYEDLEGFFKDSGVQFEFPESGLGFVDELLQK
jgi:hypothetical protein